MVRVVVLAACCSLSACGVNKYCVTQQDYQIAGVVPELRPAAGLQLPDSPSALRLPPPPANRVPFGERAEDGTISCLDQPPPMPPVEPPPAVEETPG